MRLSTITRAGALAALAFATAGPAAALDLKSPRACPAVVVECAPGRRYSAATCGCVEDPFARRVCPAVECGRGLRMDRETCACVSKGTDDERYRTYRQFGEALGEAAGSGDKTAVADFLSARFDGR